METKGPWFFAPPQEWGDDEIVLPDEESHHALKVLRIRPPDVVTVFDGLGAVAVGAAARTEGQRLVVEVLARHRGRAPVPRIGVYQGMAKGHKTDDVAERLAELGVAEFTAFASRRAVARWDEKRRTRQVDRWRSIARSVAKQSRNPFPMEITGPLDWPDLVRRVEDEVRAVVLWEGATLPLRTALEDGLTGIGLVVGPEGGMAEDEAHELADVGAALVTLGPLILRTENAGFAAAAAVAHHYGLLG